MTVETPTYAELRAAHTKVSRASNELYELARRAIDAASAREVEARELRNLLPNQAPGAALIAPTFGELLAEARAIKQFAADPADALRAAGWKPGCSNGLEARTSRGTAIVTDADGGCVPERAEPWLVGHYDEDGDMIDTVTLP